MTTYHSIGGAGFVLTGAQVYSAVVAAAAGGGFAPTDISGCQLWLDASDAATLYTDDAGTTPVSADGDAIGSWSNKGTAGGLATQATPGSRPTYKTGIQSGLSVARFDGGDFLTGPDLQYGNITVFAVAVNTSSTGNQVLVAYPHATTHTSPFFRWSLFRSNASLRGHWNGSFGAASVDYTPWHLYTLIDADVYLDGSRIIDGSDENLIYPNNVYVRIGANAAGLENWNGDIAEIIIYNSALGTTDRESIESYLATKWGL